MALRANQWRRILQLETLDKSWLINRGSGRGSLIHNEEGSDLIPMQDRKETGNWLEQAQYFEHHRKWEDAEKFYRKFLEQPGTPAKILARLGDVLREQQRFLDAIEYYYQSLEQNPVQAQTWYNLGYCLEEIQNHQKAIEAYRNAIRSKSDYTDAVFSLARCYQHIQQISLAKQYWQRYLELDPDSPWSHVARRHLTS